MFDEKWSKKSIENDLIAACKKIFGVSRKWFKRYIEKDISIA